MTTLLPPALRRPDAKGPLLDWVSRLPVDPLDRKQVLLDWAALTGVYLTADEIQATITPPEPEGKKGGVG